MQTILFKVLVAGGLAAFALVIGIVLRRQFVDLHEFVCRTPKWQRVFLGVSLVVFIAFGGSKNDATNNAALPPPAPTSLTSIVNLNLPPQPCSLPTVTPEDISRGWRLWEVRTNATVSYAMPEGSALATNWWMRGAYEDVLKIGIGEQGTGDGGWCFPLGSNEYDSVWAYTWGKIRPHLRDVSNEIAAVGAPMSAIPGRSRFWTAATTNSYLLTWEDFALGRVGKDVVGSGSEAEGIPLLRCISAQIELFTTGDFITRSNDVERICRRIDPEDWDGDGWRNDDDWCPYDWDESWDDFWQELPEGANTNAYCWIDVRCDYSSWVSFVGDGPSDLWDPSFTALAGRTYRVMLLIGKTYEIESAHPLTVVGRSDPSIEVDGDGTCDLAVVWPVEMYALEGNGNGFMMFVLPSCLAGIFTWTNSCCPITGYGNHFWYAHTGYCWCDGCYAQGTYAYEGYGLWCEGGYCDCPWYCRRDDPHDTRLDDGPYAGGATVSFSKSAVIFEDAYTNKPGEVVSRQSTRTIFHCVAHGGGMGGTASFTMTGADKLVSVTGGSLPVTQFVPPCQKMEFDIEYEGRSPSGSEGDIVATATFTESGSSGSGSSSTAELTSVRVSVVASHVAVDNPNENRHIYGVGEESVFRFEPTSCEVNALASCGLLSDVRNGQAEYSAPGEGCSPAITVTCADAQKEISLDIYEPDGYEVQGIGAVFYDLPNEAGLIDLNFTNRINPRVVSFYAVEVMEIAMISTNAVGYFAQPEHADDLDHGKRGAYGQWSGVNDDNSTADLARMGLCAKPWNDGGSYTWPIPNAWRVRGDLFATNVFTHTDQRFELDADGTARVMKFGWTGERGTNNQHRVCEEVSR